MVIIEVCFGMSALYCNAVHFVVEGGGPLRKTVKAHRNSMEAASTTDSVEGQSICIGMALGLGRTATSGRVASKYANGTVARPI